MLAVEPTALIFSSAGAKAGVAEAGPFSAIGEFDFDSFVAQDVVLDSFDTSKPGNRAISRYATVSDLESFKINQTGAPRTDLWQWLLARKFVQSDPSDSTAFQILRKLHIAYPADKNDTRKLAGSGRFPLVVLLHGHHAWIEGSNNAHVPNHRGYIYLQRELASWGIISVSLDTNIANCCQSLVEMRAESILKTLDSLWTLDDSVTSSPLHQRLDFQRIGLVGHSRGGDAVVKAAIINSNSSARAGAGVARKYGIKAVCSLAPTDVTGTATAARSSLDTSQAPCFIVLYGALDGDVSGKDEADGLFGTGFRLYDRADTEKAMIFFEGCNHNRFNDVWTGNDTYFAQQNALLSREDHRSLAKEYIGGLFRWRLLASLGPQGLFNGAAKNIIGENCSVQWSFGLRHKLDDMEGDDANDGTRHPLAGSSLDSMKDVTKRQTTILSVLTDDIYTNHQTTVLTTAKNPTATPVIAYKLSFSPAQDWTSFSHLIFRVCADADVSQGFDPQTIAPPDFTVIIADSSANSTRVTAAALRTPDRPRSPTPHLEPITDTTTGAVLDEINCTVVHLETLAVALGQVGGMTLNSIAGISIEVPGNANQRQFFDSIELVKI